VTITANQGIRAYIVVFPYGGLMES